MIFEEKRLHLLFLSKNLIMSFLPIKRQRYLCVAAGIAHFSNLFLIVEQCSQFGCIYTSK